MSDQNSKFVIKITQEDHDEFTRLDQVLASKLEQSRSFLKELFKKGSITSNVKIELKKMPAVGTEVLIDIPPPRESTAKAEDIPLKILFEDEHLAIVVKPVGMVTHPAPGNYTGTLVNAILHHCKDIQGVGDEKRPGIVHRLDKGTSGVMVVAKNQKCHEELVKLFQAHDIDRYYECISVSTKLAPEGRLESTIGRHPNNRLKMAVNVRTGKNSITNYKVLKYYQNLSHVELKLETGRTHQIRVHLSQLLNAPILMDPLYGVPKNDLLRVDNRLRAIIKDYEHPFLHAKILGFTHPITKEKLYFEEPPPPIFQEVLDFLESESE